MIRGQVYGEYEIVRSLGRGAMGDVYLAVNRETGSEIALKIVYNDPDDAQIIEAESIGAELQKRLSGVDPRVVAVYRYGERNSDLFIEMEYIDGEDLSALLARGPLDPHRAARIAADLCEMLENLRAFTTTIGDKQFTGVIHGDLKPRNIRIDPSEQVKVIDFGIAKALSHTRKHTINLFASAAYCSPERLDTQNMDTHSDLWSVGVLLYQMIAGRLPFDEPSLEKLERRIRSPQPPDPLPASCPAPLRDIVFRMLAHDPGRRYPTALEARQELVRFLNGEKVEAWPFDGDATIRTAPPPPRKPSRITSRFAVFGVLAAVAVIFTLMQLSVWSGGQKLRQDLETEHVSLDDAWTSYQKLEARSHMPLLLWSARRTLKSKLVAAAEAPIREYRDNDVPRVSEAHWKEARARLSRALELDPGNREIEGKKALCEGHLDRISARGAARQKKLNTAVEDFRRAAELLRRSPDPWLGLARMYVYDLNDMDRAQEAIENADRYGHPVGRREKAQLADGYLRRAQRWINDSRAFINLPDQEREYLQNARQDYLRAQDLYQQVGAFGDATRNRIQAILGQQRVEQRLTELQSGIPAQ